MIGKVEMSLLYYIKCPYIYLAALKSRCVNQTIYRRLKLIEISVPRDGLF